MKGNWGMKSKVLHSVKSRHQILNRKIKKEKSCTPQRWSRRIRSLPPIPFNALNSSRKIKTSKSVVETTVEPSRKNIGAAGDRDIKVVYKNAAVDDPDTIETIKIVPVVVYVKNRRPELRSLSDDLEIQICQKCSSHKFCETSQDNFIHKKIKQECSSLERKWSRKLQANHFV